MVENPTSFRDYANAIREVLKDEFGEEFIEELSNERAIDELKTYEAIISDNANYENALIVSSYYDGNEDLVIEVGQAISQAGLREFDEIQNDLHDVMEEIREDLDVLQHEQRLRAVHRGSTEGEVVMDLTIGIVDYGIYHMDEYGQRWALFLPYTGVKLRFRSKPPIEALKRIVKWAISDYTQSMAYGWLRDYIGDYIDRLVETIEDSWDIYQKATGGDKE